MSDGQKLEKAAFFIATGKPFSAGRVYMVSFKGTILSSVGLRYAPAGMAFHTRIPDDCGLVVAIPAIMAGLYGSTRREKSRRFWNETPRAAPR